MQTDGNRSRSRLHNLVRPVLNGLLAFVVSFSLFNVAGFAYAVDKVKVPDVVNKTLKVATNELESQGFRWQIADGCSTYDGATVTETDPWPNSQADFGSTITLWTEEKEIVIDEMTLGYWNNTQEDQSLVQFPATDNGQVPMIDTRYGSVQLAASVKWRGGSYVLATSEAGGLGSGDLLWGSSDEGVATVDPYGLVTATGAADGVVTITCTLTNDLYTPKSVADAGGFIQAQIAVQIIGQAGAYPIAVAIVNEENVPIGADGIVIEASDGTAEYQPYVRVMYSDGTFKCNAPYCDPSIYASEIAGLEWSGGNSQIAYVNKTSGLITPIKDAHGSTEVIATVQGGRDGAVSDTVFLNIEGLSEAQPAETLTVRVVYSQDLGTDVSSKVYTPTTIAQASQSGALVDSPYTQVRTTGTFRTMSGRGVYVEDILADVGVKDTSEVVALMCSATDGTQQGFVPASVLFDQANYYFPNFDATNAQGVHNTSGGYRVYPMIAVASYVADNSTKVDFNNLNETSRFELLLGNNGNQTGDYAAHYSIYCIYELDIILAGAPPIDFGKDDDGGPQEPGGPQDPGDGDGDHNGDGQQPSGDDGANGDPDDSGNGTGGQDDEGKGDEGTANGDQTGGDNHDGNNAGASVVLGIGGNPTDADLNDAQADSGAQGSQSPSSSLSALLNDGSYSAEEIEALDEMLQEEIEKKEEEAEKVEEADDTKLPETGRKYSVFEMMSKSNDDFDIDHENPLAPFMLPAACTLAAASGTISAARQSKEQGHPWSLKKLFRALFRRNRAAYPRKPY